jgi:hypothetical protein
MRMLGDRGRFGLRSEHISGVNDSQHSYRLRELGFHDYLHLGIINSRIGDATNSISNP